MNEISQNRPEDKITVDVFMDMVKKKLDEKNPVEENKEIVFIKYLLGGGGVALISVLIFAFNLGINYSSLKSRLDAINTRIETLDSINQQKINILTSKVKENKSDIENQIKNNHQTIKSIEEKLNKLSQDMATVKAKLENQ